MLYKRLLILLFVLVTIANAGIYLNRNNYTFVKQSTYNELYPNYSSLSVHAFTILNDSVIEVLINQPGKQPVQWNILQDDSLHITYTGIYPRITVSKGLHKYKIFNALKDSFYMQAENYSAADYKKFNLTKPGSLSVFNADLLQDGAVTNLDKWRDDEILFSAEEKKNIAALLKDSVRITGTDSTVEKIKKIGCYLGTKLFASRGGPTDSLLALSVFDQYKCAAGGATIWCGNYAMIFNLFAHIAGIKTRHVEVSKTRSGVAGNLHVFNEYFIPEQKKWACIDLTFNNIFYTRSNGQLLNAVEVKDTDPSDSSITVWQPETVSSVKAIRFHQLEKLFFETYGSTNDLKFYLSLNYNESNNLIKKFKRYFQEKYYYELYSDNILTDNRNFYIKQFFLWLQYIFTGLFILLLILKQFRLQHD